MKYELINENRPDGLLRLKALTDIPGVCKAGDVGGLVAGPENLSQEGACWVYVNARVSGGAQVYGSAQVSGNAVVYGSAQVYGSADVSGSASVSGSAVVFGSAVVLGSANITSSKDYMMFSGLGSEGRHCTLFRTVDGHRLSAGCWSGTIDEFEKRVLDAYGRESDYLTMMPALRAKVATWAARSHV